VADAVSSFVKSRPQAIIMLSNAAASSAFIEQYRAAGGAAQLFVYSGADMERVIKRMAEKRGVDSANAVKGVAVVQVVPSPYQNSKLVKELHEALASQGSTDLKPSYVMLEGFIAAKTIVEAVRRQGRRPSREGMSVALDGIEDLDLGGHVLGYKSGTRSGSTYVELTIITDTGKIRH
jgi:ABC-type branched-subunit amino acid transport system substrate-binding protein